MKANQKISVLHIGKFYPPHSGGIETYVQDLATRQAKQFQVNVIVANEGAAKSQSIDNGVIVTRIPRLATVASMPICPTLIHAIRRCPADIVHIHTPNPAAALAFLLSGHRGKLVITHHSDTLGRKFLRKISDPFVLRAMQKAEAIIVTSHRYLDSSDELACFRDKCHVIPLGIDLSRFAVRYENKIREIKAKFGDRIVLAVGRLVSYKGFDYLIDAMARVRGFLIVLGDGPEMERLQHLAVEKNVSNRVIIQRVNRTDIPSFYHASDVFALPSISRQESFGIVQLEAMAAGLPVVNTMIDSGAPEVSIDGQTGITVPAKDSVVLAKAIESLLDDAKMRHQFGVAARIRVNEKFTADRMAKDSIALYREVLR
jgi:glycosyltransferase involved in cell wall biosynthesis